MEEKRMSIGDHLDELRSRIIRCLIYLVVALVICLFFQDTLMQVVTWPHRRTMISVGRDRFRKRLGELETHAVQTIEEIHGLEQEIDEKQRRIDINRGHLRGADWATVHGTVLEKARKIKAAQEELIALQEKLLAARKQEAEDRETPEEKRAKEDKQAKGEKRATEKEKPAKGPLNTAALDARIESLRREIADFKRDMEGRVRIFLPVEPSAPNIQRLRFLRYQEVFLNYLKVSLICAIFLASPIMAFEIWRFIAAGLYPSEKKYVQIFAPLSLVNFILGILFGYFILIPVGLRYLATFGHESLVQSSITLGDYLSLFITLTLAVGLIFELPLVMIFLSFIGIVDPEDFSAYRRYFIIVALVLGAFLTPPDIFTQLMMAIPLLVLFELGVWASKLVVKRRG
jgi:Tat protein translocase TatC